MKLFFSLFSIMIISISSANAVESSELARSIALGKSKTFNAVGYVDVVNPEDGGLYEGTATHIGNGILVTAAHTLYDLFPKNIPRSGPVVIDVTNKQVFWSNNQSSFDIDQVKRYKASQVVVDARFIRNFKPEDLTPEAIAHDIAFIKLEEVPNTGSIPMVSQLEKLPDYGILVGYGSLSFSIKHAFSQTIGLRAPLNQSRELISDVDRYDIVDYVASRPARIDSCDVIFARECQLLDIFSFDASPGDSGGPLLVNINGKPHIIAILSYGSQEQIPGNEFAYDDPDTPYNESVTLSNPGNYFLGSIRSLDDPIVTAYINGYVSLISGRPGNFAINGDVDRLLKALTN